MHQLQTWQTPPVPRQPVSSGPEPWASLAGAGSHWPAAPETWHGGRGGPRGDAGRVDGRAEGLAPCPSHPRPHPVEVGGCDLDGPDSCDGPISESTFN